MTQGNEPIDLTTLARLRRDHAAIQEKRARLGRVAYKAEVGARRAGLDAAARNNLKLVKARLTLATEALGLANFHLDTAITALERVPEEARP